jgi:hypothetical protein
MDPALTFQNGLRVGQDGSEPSPEERGSDCVESQGRRVAHRVHRLWDRMEYPACGLVGNAPRFYLFAGPAEHGSLHRLLVFSIALRI